MDQLDTLKALIEGIQHEEIIGTLNANGFDLNLNTFRSYLYRYRRKLRGTEARISPVKSPASADCNSSVQVTGEGEKLPDDASPSLADTLDARKRAELGDQYVSRQRPLFSKRSEQE